MKFEKSCGTIIIRNNKVLLIKQHQGFYGFPKGHVENNETEIETATRETKEETNIDVKINEKMRFETIYLTDKNVHKTVVLFLAEPINNEIIIQQEELLDANWFEFEEVENILTYDNLKELWRKVLYLIKSDYKK